MEAAKTGMAKGEERADVVPDASRLSLGYDFTKAASALALGSA